MNTDEAVRKLRDLRDENEPYPIFESARRAGAVQKIDGTWFVLGHAAGRRLLRSNATRSGFIADGYRNLLPPGAAREEMSHRVNFLDPPRHTRVRSLVGKAFTPKRTATLRPFVEEIARRLLAPLAGDEPVDLVKSFAHEVPSLVISELLGVPVENRDRLTQLSDRVSRLLGTGITDEERRDAISGAEEMHSTLRALVAERRREPQDDLLSALLAAEENDDRLTESELLSLAATLYSAGHRTTRDLFSNGVATLLGHPEQAEAVRSGTIPTSAVIEEFLRYETPTHKVMRMLIEPMEFDDATIGPGEPIVVVLAAANRDPEAYDGADRFDPLRWIRDPEPPPSLSFAMGAHFCVGASLARLEAGVMLEILNDTFPTARLAGDRLRWNHTGVFRGVESLPIIPGCATGSR